VLVKTGQKRTKRFSRLWRRWASNVLSNQRIRNNKIDCGLTIEELVSIVPAHCPCCGNNFVLKDATKKRSPSVDRIDNSKGYTKENIWAICYSCNRQKNDAESPESLYAVADAWWKIRKEKIKNKCK
jgi:5-methylcytosine-specific restriction endonuclease McrA